MIAKRGGLAADEFEHAYPGCQGRIVEDETERICTSCGASANRRDERTPPHRNAAVGMMDARSYYALGTGMPKGVTRFRPRYESWKTIRAAKLDEMIEMVSGPLGMSTSAKMTAVALGRKLLRGSALRRASLRSICIYCVVQASRATGTHRTLDEILEVFRVDAPSLTNRTFREFNKIARASSLEYRNASPEEYIKLIIKRLSRRQVAEEVYMRAVFRKASDVLISMKPAVVGKNPWCVAAYCIYRADDELGYQIGLDVVCSATRLTPERLTDFEEKILSVLPGQRRIARRPVEQTGYEVFKAEAHSFKISLRRSS